MLANDSANIVKVIKENYEVGLYIDLKQCFYEKFSQYIEGSEAISQANDSSKNIKVIKALSGLIKEIGLYIDLMKYFMIDLPSIFKVRMSLC